MLDVIREARFEAGHRLREQQLADLLQVSRTPVRAALALLAERGLVESRPNQGYVLVRPSQDLDQIVFEVPTTADRDLYDRLVVDRLAGEIPLSLTQSEIERRYDVDRAVLLRVLSRLAEDGLVARNEGRGWTFLPTLDSSKALRNSYDFRLTIEPAGFLLPTFRFDPVVLERCRLNHLYFEAHPDIATVDRRQLFEADAAFHEMCAEFSGNAFFLQSMQQQNRLRRLLEFGGYTNRRRVRDWCREHLAIMEAIRTDARDEAAAMMRDHLSRAYRLTPASDGRAGPPPRRRPG
jgi:DNA-binding GntR family transcriptional regulator